MAELKSAYDLVIIGAGPSGLAAAIYAGREGMDTVIVDRGVFGGMAAITEMIENYPGFRDGVGGQAMIDEMTAQSERFGAQSAPFHEVTALQTTAQGCTLEINARAKVMARAVLVATGSTYRKLAVPGEEALIGRGVHYCATCDGPIYRGKKLVAVGSGNSALQESLFLARFAEHVELLVRGDHFKGSEVLVRQLEAEPNITVRFNTSITEVARASAKDPVHLSVKQPNGTSSTETADGVFVFVGLLPNTDHLDHLEHDERGFLITDDTLQTNMPGVFVSGDVRSGSTWQIASAVGEGVTAALHIRAYLDEMYPDWHRRANERTTATTPEAV